MFQYVSKERGKVFYYLPETPEQTVQKIDYNTFPYYFSNYAFESFFTKYLLKIIKILNSMVYKVCSLHQGHVPSPLDDQ